MSRILVILCFTYSIFWPQLLQNFVPSGFSWPQLGHFIILGDEVAAPQLEQNFAPFGFSKPHFPHFSVSLTNSCPQLEQKRAPVGFCVLHFEQIFMAPAAPPGCMG